MWYEQFLQLIDRSRLGEAIERRRQLLVYGDAPGRIYVENVRAFFGMSHRVAKALCDLAVRHGLFERYTAVMCPHDERVLLELRDEVDESVGVINCEVCETLEVEPSEFKQSDCRTMAFYRVHAYEPSVDEANG